MSRNYNQRYYSLMLRDWGYKFPQNIVQCFRGANLLWQLLAIALTYVLVTSGFDWFYFESTRATWFQTFGFPAAILGFFVPVLIPVGLYGIGRARKSEALKRVSAAMGQAVIVGWLISSFYKAFTGRLHPDLVSQLPSADISHIFNFGPLKNGIFWGWPSSHTTVAFALAAAVITLYPKRKGIVAAAALYALYIGLGVSVTIHWFSDFAAGAIFGTLIGIVVAHSFRDRQHTQA